MMMWSGMCSSRFWHAIQPSFGGSNGSRRKLGGVNEARLLVLDFFQTNNLRGSRPRGAADRGSNRGVRRLLAIGSIAILGDDLESTVRLATNFLALPNRMRAILRHRSRRRDHDILVFRLVRAARFRSCLAIL